MQPLYDMHCHLDFAEDGLAAAQDMVAAGAGAFSATVTPDGYRIASEAFATHMDVRVGVGLHPWWVADGTCGSDSLEQVLSYIDETPFVGEVGLDFGKKHGTLRTEQTLAFDKIIGHCARLGDRVITIHSVKAASQVLDILEAHRATGSCACILHWYSGPTDQLWRAIDMGCYFSVGAFMVRTGRGKEYAKLIPPELLLLETDEPPAQTSYSFPTMQQQMAEVLDTLEQIKGVPLRETIAATSRKLLNLG